MFLSVPLMTVIPMEVGWRNIASPNMAPATWECGPRIILAYARSLTGSGGDRSRAAILPQARQTKSSKETGTGPPIASNTRSEALGTMCKGRRSTTCSTAICMWITGGYPKSMKEDTSQCLPTALSFGGSFQTRRQDA